MLFWHICRAERVWFGMSYLAMVGNNVTYVIVYHTIGYLLIFDLSGGLKMDKMVRVRFTEDKKAAFIGDKQYISFERLAEIRRDQAKEIKRDFMSRPELRNREAEKWFRRKPYGKEK